MLHPLPILIWSTVLRVQYIFTVWVLCGRNSSTNKCIWQTPDWQFTVVAIFIVASCCLVNRDACLIMLLIWKFAGGYIDTAAVICLLHLSISVGWCCYGAIISQSCAKLFKRSDFGLVAKSLIPTLFQTLNINFGFLIVKLYEVYASICSIYINLIYTY
jgi:hypothetical protein